MPLNSYWLIASSIDLYRCKLQPACVSSSDADSGGKKESGGGQMYKMCVMYILSHYR